MKTIKPYLIAAISFYAAVAIAHAAEIRGTVSSATEEYATVTTDSDLFPVPGDKAEIFFKMPGKQVEISVASGHVYEITGSNIMVKIGQATGTVSKDQLVRIASEKPQKRTVSATPPPNSAPTSSVPPDRGRNPSFAFVDFEKVFNSHPKRKEWEATMKGEKSRERLDAIVEEVRTQIKGMAGDVNFVIDRAGQSLNGVLLAVSFPAQADMTTRISATQTGSQPAGTFEGVRDVQVAHVDMNRLFKSLNRTKESEAKINAAKAVAKKEYDNRVATYNKHLDAIKSMKQGPARDNATTKFKQEEADVNSFRREKEKELQETAMKMRDGVVKTMTDAINARANGLRSPLVLDTSGLSGGGNPMFLFVAGVPDWSEELIAELNAGGGKNKGAAAGGSSADLKFACLDLYRALTTLPEGKQVQQEMDALLEQAKAENPTADQATVEAKMKELTNINSQKIAPTLKKIQDEVARIARAQGYNLVLNSSGETLNSTPWLIISQNVADITDPVIARLSGAAR